MAQVRTFLTIPMCNTDVESGLLSFQFHPDFKNNGYLYLGHLLASLGVRLCRLGRALAGYNRPIVLLGKCEQQRRSLHMEPDPLG